MTADVSKTGGETGPNRPRHAQEHNRSTIFFSMPKDCIQASPGGGTGASTAPFLNFYNVWGRAQRFYRPVVNSRSGEC